MKEYIFAVEKNHNKYYLSEFFLNLSLRSDSLNLDKKISNILHKFHDNYKNQFLVIVKENDVIINEVYFKTFAEMNNAFREISLLYNQELKERLDYLETLNSKEIENFQII